MRFIRRARRTNSDKNLISLINIVFLILVFFMIMGRIAPPAVIEVDPPSSTRAAAVEPDGIVVLIGSDGRIAVDSEIIPLTALLKAISLKIERGEAPTASAVTIKADGDMRVAQLDHIMNILRTLGVVRLSLVTDKVR